MESPPALCTTGDLRGGRCAVLFGINGFPSWGFAIGAMHAHRPHHLATYPHQLFSRGAGLVSPQVSLLPRLACVAQQARVALWAVRVLPSLAADGAFAQVLGMAAGSAIRVRVSRSRVLLSAFVIVSVRWFRSALSTGWPAMAIGLQICGGRV